MNNQFDAIIEAIKKNEVADLKTDAVHCYTQSLTEYEGTRLMMVKSGYTKFILAIGDGVLYKELEGEVHNDSKICALTHENRLVLNRHLDYTVPKSFGAQIATIGLGDRLGMASPGHIKTIQNKDVKPILAQQSIRELNLTGRNYEEVLDAAAYAVFQEGYRGGYGADADHLKVEEEIQMALDLGFTMITLDCSEQINHSIVDADPSVVEEKYQALPADVRSDLEDRYVDQHFQAGDHTLHFYRERVMRNALIYGEAIQYMHYIYDKYIRGLGRPVDFEISIDETLTPTLPESHYFVATELYREQVEVFSIAPRFCGEFEKGIDYIGDLDQFEQELRVHAAIADHFGYKLSIHSGSDKFSVFPMIGQYTGGRFHVKTAGTNWLEAVRTVAKVHPDLYRRMHRYALEHVEEALAYYHVSMDTNLIRPLDQATDAQLLDYMDEDNARQLIHITFGILLQAKNEQGNSLFKDEFLNTLMDQEEEYEHSLQTHIGKHLERLGK